MPWVSRLLRGERVWARIASDGSIVSNGDGRVDILYKKGGKVYRAATKNLSDDPRAEVLTDEEINEGERVADKPKPAGGASATAGQAGHTHHSKLGNGRPLTSQDPFVVYADGACTGNPGPAGLGVVLLDGKARRELSEYLGQGTNNVAELMAIVRALEEAPRDRTVVVHSDSSYALGLLGKGWKAKANQDLVERMRRLAREFHDLRLVKVEGHSGIPENERADALARAAVGSRGR